jgi:large subunit ribosomal protein L24
MKLKIKTGDTVQVISGKDKGKTGKVLRVFPDARRIMIENINIHTKFQKSRRAGQPGTKISLPSPFPISKVMLIDNTSGKPTRVSFQFLDNGTKQRIGSKSRKAV